MKQFIEDIVTHTFEVLLFLVIGIIIIVLFILASNP